jgi:hypothetical protein
MKPLNPRGARGDLVHNWEGRDMAERKPRVDRDVIPMRHVEFTQVMAPQSEPTVLGAAFNITGSNDFGDPVEIDFNFNSNLASRPHTYLSVYATKIGYGKGSRAYYCEGVLSDIQPAEIISMTLARWFYT